MPAILLRNKFLLFAALWGLSILLYLYAYEAGFYADFHYALERYETLSFTGFLNREGIPNVSLYQGTQLLLYILISIFHAHALPWFLLFTALHALVGSMLFYSFRRYGTMMQVSGINAIAGIALLAYMLTPLNVVTVVWKACLHYFTGLIIIFGILQLLMSYMTRPRWKYILWIWVLYMVSATMLELFYITPALVLIISFSVYYSGRLDKKIFHNIVWRIFVPMLLIWCLYLLTYRLMYGKWIAHYNFDLQYAFSWSNVWSKLTKDYLHILFFESALPPDIRSKVLAFTEYKVVNIVVAILLFTGLAMGLLRYRRMRPALQLLYSAWLMELVCNLLIIPMWFNSFSAISNDQHYFLPLIFLLLCFSIVLQLLFRNKKVRYTIAGIYLLISTGVAAHFITIQRDAGRVHRSLLRNFSWQQSDTVVFLSMPFFYKGVWALPTEPKDIINPHLKVFGYDTIQGVSYNVSSYNMNSMNDGTIAVVKDSLTIAIKPAQYGSWWWGTLDYENELYHFKTIDDASFNAEIRFKHPLSDKVVLLQQKGMTWQRVDMHQRNTEQ